MSLKAKAMSLLHWLLWGFETESECKQVFSFYRTPQIEALGDDSLLVSAMCDRFMRIRSGTWIDYFMKILFQELQLTVMIPFYRLHDSISINCNVTSLLFKNHAAAGYIQCPDYVLCFWQITLRSLVGEKRTPQKSTNCYIAIRFFYLGFLLVDLHVLCKMFCSIGIRSSILILLELSYMDCARVFATWLSNLPFLISLELTCMHCSRLFATSPCDSPIFVHWSFMHFAWSARLLFLKTRLL